MALTALWCESKPKPETFLLPFVQDAQKLDNEGFTWIWNGISHVSRVRFIMCVLDAPARAMVANVNQLNGERNMMVVGILLTPELELRKEMVMFRSILKKNSFDRTKNSCHDFTTCNHLCWTKLDAFSWCEGAIYSISSSVFQCCIWARPRLYALLVVGCHISISKVVANINWCSLLYLTCRMDRPSFILNQTAKRNKTNPKIDRKIPLCVES